MFKKVIRFVNFTVSGRDNGDLDWGSGYKYCANIGDRFLLLDEDKNDTYFHKFKIDEKRSNGLGWLKVRKGISGVEITEYEFLEYLNQTEF